MIVSAWITALDCTYGYIITTHGGYQQMDRCHSMSYFDYNAQHVSLLITKLDTYEISDP